MYLSKCSIVPPRCEGEGSRGHHVCFSLFLHHPYLSYLFLSLPLSSDSINGRIENQASCNGNIYCLQPGSTLDLDLVHAVVSPDVLIAVCDRATELKSRERRGGI
ncbi:hypothetical protein Ancab_039201 [Ancistrocladus abbreviatus]